MNDKEHISERKRKMRKERLQNRKVSSQLSQLRQLAVDPEIVAKKVVNREIEAMNRKSRLEKIERYIELLKRGEIELLDVPSKLRNHVVRLKGDE